MFAPFTPFSVMYKEKIWNVICVDSEIEIVQQVIESDIDPRMVDEDDKPEEKFENVELCSTRLLIGRKDRKLIWVNLENVKFNEIENPTKKDVLN